MARPLTRDVNPTPHALPQRKPHRRDSVTPRPPTRTPLRGLRRPCVCACASPSTQGGPPQPHLSGMQEVHAASCPPTQLST